MKRQYQVCCVPLCRYVLIAFPKCSLPILVIFPLDTEEARQDISKQIPTSKTMLFLIPSKTVSVKQTDHKNNGSILSAYNANHPQPRNGTRKIVRNQPQRETIVYNIKECSKIFFYKQEFLLVKSEYFQKLWVVIPLVPLWAHRCHIIEQHLFFVASNNVLFLIKLNF
jgi:hypothetical protein